MQIDLTWAKARRAGTAAQRQGLAALTGILGATSQRGRPLRSRRTSPSGAALSRADLDSDPAARGDARAALARARALTAPEDVLAGDRLAAAWLRTGDPRLAEAQSRSGLSHLATRRRTRLLLAESLLRLNQGAEALNTLEPLLAGSAGIEDSEAALLKARVLLSLNDTLEAQKTGAQAGGQHRCGAAGASRAQRVLGRVSLILGEPATARRTLEPLVVRQLAGATATDAQLRDEQLDTQILWAEVLLAVRPAEQNEARAILEAVVTRAPSASKPACSWGACCARFRSGDRPSSSSVLPCAPTSDTREPAASWPACSCSAATTARHMRCIASWSKKSRMPIC